MIYKYKSRFIKYTNIICLLLFIRFVILLFFQFFMPDLGEVIITVTADAERIDSRIISIEPPPQNEHYYLLIHEETIDSHWLYFTDGALASPNNNDILDNFLTEDYQDYIFIESNGNHLPISFSIMSKYPLNYMSTMEHIFHVHYIIPIRLFPFSTFYYNKHHVFFVDPIF